MQESRRIGLRMRISDELFHGSNEITKLWSASCDLSEKRRMSLGLNGCSTKTCIVKVEFEVGRPTKTRQLQLN